MPDIRHRAPAGCPCCCRFAVAFSAATIAPSLQQRLLAPDGFCPSVTGTKPQRCQNATARRRFQADAVMNTLLPARTRRRTTRLFHCLRAGGRVHQRYTLRADEQPSAVTAAEELRHQRFNATAASPALSESSGFVAGDNLPSDQPRFAPANMVIRCNNIAVLAHPLVCDPAMSIDEVRPDGEWIRLRL